MTGTSTTGKSASPPPGIQIERIDFSHPLDPALEGWKVVAAKAPREQPERPPSPTSGSIPESNSSARCLAGLPDTEAVYFPDQVYGSVEAAYTAAVLWSQRYQEEPDWSDTTNISRVDTGPKQGDTHGDFVRVQRQGTLRKKFFSDAHFGGKKGSRHAALIWRELIKGQLPEALSLEAARKKSAAKQSQFDVPGMTVIERMGTDGFVHPALQVRWTTPEGQVRRHIISLLKWSPRQGVWNAAKRIVEEYEAGNVDVRRSYLFSALPESWFEETSTTERIQQLFERAVSGAREEAEKILQDRDEALEGIPGLSLAVRKRNGRYVPILKCSYQARTGESKSRSRALGRSSLASATRDLCKVLVDEFEGTPPEEFPSSSGTRTSPVSIFRTGLSTEEQVEHLTRLALPSLQKEMRDLLSEPPGICFYFQRLASGRYSPMVEVTWEASSGGLRRGVSSALKHTLRGALLKSLEKAARALASRNVRQASLFGRSSPFSNLSSTARRNLGFSLKGGPGDDTDQDISDLFRSEDAYFELIAQLYGAALPSIEAAYHLRVVHGAPGLRIEGTRESPSQTPPSKEATEARLIGEWPRLDDSSWARSEASISELGLAGALKQVLEALGRQVYEGRVDVETALLENSPVRALEISTERLGTLPVENFQEMLFDKLYPPLCALQRIEDGPENRRTDRFVGTHLSIESGADVQDALR